jgi:Protein tyrosine and serine/threonine kinase
LYLVKCEFGEFASVVKLRCACCDSKPVPERRLEFVRTSKKNRHKWQLSVPLQVYLARLNGVSNVAVKQLKAEHACADQQESFLMEISMLKSLTHSNIVQFQVGLT